MKKAILITGAAGGLGQALVMAAEASFPGMLIVATDLPAPLSGLRYTERTLCLPLDVTDEPSIVAVRHELERRNTMVWGLLNNAGISDFFPVSERSKHHLDRLFAINTFGPVNMVRVFLPHLAATGGRVVQISSESVRLPAAFHPYAASKIAQEALSVSMRHELALLGVSLSIVRPGAIKTPFLDDLTAMKARIGDSIYKDALLAFAGKAPKQILHIAKPGKVAATAIRALTSGRPRRYYHVNNNPLLRIAQLLPQAWKDYFMQRMLRREGG